MSCPICKLDLSPLDYLSRAEHAELCLDNGPALLDYNEAGQAVIRKNIPPNKQRKICPICDKTFQTIHLHYKKCALKNDILPDLMLDHWDQLNKDSKTTKKFPRDLLEGFIARRIREGRAGEQVEYARGLLLSIVESEPPTSSSNRLPLLNQPNTATLVNDNDTNQSIASSNEQFQNQQQVPLLDDYRASGSSNSNPTIDGFLRQAQSVSAPAKPRGKPAKKFRIELVDEVVKRVNIDLRRERELAASTERRFLRIQASIEEQEKSGESSSTQGDKYTIDWLDRLS